MKKPVPFFELYVSFLSIILSLVMLRDMSLLSEGLSVYKTMLTIASGTMWSIIFSGSALIKVIGLVKQVPSLRKLGLVTSTLIHGTISYCYILNGGFLGASAFGMTAIFCIISIFDVDKTQLK